MGREHARVSPHAPLATWQRTAARTRVLTHGPVLPASCARWWVPKQFGEDIEVPEVETPDIEVPEINVIKTVEEMKAALEDTKPKFIAPIFYTWSYFRMYKPSWIFQTKYG